MSEPSTGRSLPWFRVDVDLVDHPKVLALAEALDCAEAEAGWLVVRLWAWTMRYAARGRLADGARPALERLWTGAGTAPRSGSAVDALVSAGFLDAAEGGGWEVHDWDEHNGAAVAKAEKDAERKRAARARRSNGRGQSADGRADGAGNGTGRDGTLKEGSNASASTPPLQLEALPAKVVKARKPPDPKAEFERFKAACTDDELRIFDAYCTTFAVDMAPDWGLQRLVRQKLKAHTADELCAAVRGAGRDPWHREKGSSLRALFSDASRVAQLAKRGAA